MKRQLIKSKLQKRKINKFIRLHWFEFIAGVITGVIFMLITLAGMGV